MWAECKHFVGPAQVGWAGDPKSGLFARRPLEIGDAVLADAKAWQSGPLDAVEPIVSRWWPCGILLQRVRL